MGRITPRNRKEEATAWTLGLVGGVFALTELGRDVSRETIASMSKILVRGAESYQRRRIIDEIGPIAVVGVGINDEPQLNPAEILAPVIELRPANQTIPLEELPLEAA